MDETSTNTCRKLDDQTEQIHRIQDKSYDVENNLEAGDRVLKGEGKNVI
jgi:hypothetical protein